MKSFYKVLSIRIQSSFSWKNIWNVKVPLRVAFFVWSVTLEIFLTLDNLQKRNITVMEWFYTCKTCGESIDHLFLYCKVATELWSALLQLFGVEWVMPQTVSELLGS